jgi:hypothetical protein
MSKDLQYVVKAVDEINEVLRERYAESNILGGHMEYVRYLTVAYDADGDIAVNFAGQELWNSARESVKDIKLDGGAYSYLFSELELCIFIMTHAARDILILDDRTGALRTKLAEIRESKGTPVFTSHEEIRNIVNLVEVQDTTTEGSSVH